MLAVAGDAKRGEIVAGVRCGPCHHLYSSHIKVGPGLAGIYGKEPSISGVPFDVWDEVALEAWLINPRQIKPNTRMLIPAISERDRDDIIAWLKEDVAHQ
ncbi:MAG: c-type cytochrome [Mariprofundaceae bacterium]|nr:c-type cytochrome [Mariprofundaceae bacterium]